MSRIPSIFALCTAACTPVGDTGGDSPGLTRVVTQNAGTTTYLSLVADEPDEDVRQRCADWYDNNLCLLASEDLLAQALAEPVPQLLFLEEMWDQAGCDDPGRPEAVAEDPYACGLEGSQWERVIPQDLDYGCASGYPDNCIAWDPLQFQPVGPPGAAPCQGRDCSSLLVSNPAGCSVDGRIAYLEGEAETGPLVAVVVHTSAGVDADDVACRAAQLASIQQVLLALPQDTAIVMAGDFNLDPEIYTGDDAAAFSDLLQTVGLERLPTDAPTHRITQVTLDHLLVRGAAFSTQAECQVRFLDEDQQQIMFDHGFVSCDDPSGDSAGLHR